MPTNAIAKKWLLAHWTASAAMAATKKSSCAVVFATFRLWRTTSMTSKDELILRLQESEHACWQRVRAIQRLLDEANTDWEESCTALRLMLSEDEKS
jgi:hypothetical protein